MWQTKIHSHPKHTCLLTKPKKKKSSKYILKSQICRDNFLQSRQTNMKLIMNVWPWARVQKWTEPFCSSCCSKTMGVVAVGWGGGGRCEKGWGAYLLLWFYYVHQPSCKGP
jgi:hypothetical protein